MNSYTAWDNVKTLTSEQKETELFAPFITYIACIGVAHSTLELVDKTLDGRPFHTSDTTSDRGRVYDALRWPIVRSASGLITRLCGPLGCGESRLVASDKSNTTYHPERCLAVADPCMDDYHRASLTK